MSGRPVRVLHIIDGLAGGGSERWVWDTVRLSHPDRVQYRVLTVHPDLGRYVYAERLRLAGAYGRLPKETRAPAASGRLAHLFTRTIGRVPGRVREPLRWVWHTAGVLPLAGFRCRREVREFRPEVLHAHTFHGLALGLVVARLTGRPLVHTVPCLFSQMHDAGYGWTVTLYRCFHRRVAEFFTTYPAELHALGIPDDRINHLRTACDVDAVSEVRRRRPHVQAEIREQLGIPPRALVLVSVGRLHASKGHGHVVDALRQIVARGTDAHWILVGEGTERADLEKRLADANLTSRAHLVGFQEDPLPWYAAGDVYLRTLLLEGDNISSLQAMAMGLPIVGFDTGVTTDLLPVVGHGILVPPGDGAGLAAAVLSLTGAGERKRLGDRGLTYSERNGGLQPSIEDFTRTYERLAAIHSRTLKPAP